MSTFRSIDDLVRALDREKTLLKDMFVKRRSVSFRYDNALEMAEYKEERIRKENNAERKYNYHRGYEQEGYIEQS